MNIPRRTVLKATGTALALPFLPSLGWKAFAAEPPIAPPKRMVFLSFGWGVTNETWFPDKTKTGTDYPLSEGLAPLERHKSRITVIQGLSNKFANEAHWGSTFYLTGANRYAVPGSSFSNSISADQVAAEKFGKHTRFTSLQLTSKDAEQSGHSPGLSLVWNRQGKPLADRQRMLKEQRSVLDAVLAQAKAIDKTLSKEESWMTTPKPKAPLGAPGASLVGEQEIKLMYDLLVAAFQTDSTRVVTYRQPMANLIKSMGITVAPHDLSHYTPGDRMEASKQRDKKQSELLAYLLDKLEAVKEADGSSLLDNVCLAYGSNIRSIHYLDNCPTVIAGGAAGMKHGRHIVLEAKQTPLANLWLTLLQRVGIEADSFGDSTGTLGELTA